MCMQLCIFPILLIIGMPLTLIMFGTNWMSSLYGTAAQEPTGNITNSKYLEITNHSYVEEPLFTIVNGTVLNN